MGGRVLLKNNVVVQRRDPEPDHSGSNPDSTRHQTETFVKLFNFQCLSCKMSVIIVPTLYRWL